MLRTSSALFDEFLPFAPVPLMCSYLSAHQLRRISAENFHTCTMAAIFRMRPGRLQVLFRTTARSMFVDTARTPNPESLKFLPEQQVLPPEFGTGMHFDAGDKKSIRRSPLAKKIFDTDGAKNVFFGKDFISVTKKPTDSWKVLKPLIFSAILDHFSSGDPTVIDNPVLSDTDILDDDSEVVALIKELIETKVRPSVQDDGGDIFFEGFEEATGMVSVRLAGSCVGCPSSSITLRNGVENMLTHYIPEVKGLIDVTAEDSDTSHKLEFHPDTQPA